MLGLWVQCIQKPGTGLVRNYACIEPVHLHLSSKEYDASIDLSQHDPNKGQTSRGHHTYRCKLDGVEVLLQ